MSRLQQHSVRCSGERGAGFELVQRQHLRTFAALHMSAHTQAARKRHFPQSCLETFSEACQPRRSSSLWSRAGMLRKP